ncbi:hypothetical protein Xbed_03506 [Xenorhabdus beddingii]|uniref:Uncharacterized protein n=1 Tax=Xenorhabdus beddingii TaxID=40578 RepID=A0A1Y2SC10_9GAMM|nr:hypothetical protein [Xenorhabdus beddingii]OTA16205.1 hypothetical protein Xbed_03506 [Xenorhabdus beddingii]
MSTEIKLGIAELPAGLRAVIRDGQAIVIKGAGEDAIQVKTYRWHNKRVLKPATNNKPMVLRPVGMLAKPKKTLRPIGVLIGKLSIPTEEEFAKRDSEILSMFEGREQD